MYSEAKRRLSAIAASKKKYTPPGAEPERALVPQTGPNPMALRYTIEVKPQGSLPPARGLILEQLDERIVDAASRPGAGDYKTRLQESAARDGAGPPDYVITESGPDHNKVFRATVTIGGDVRGTGEGTSKKEAEQRAARDAWGARAADGEPDV